MGARPEAERAGRVAVRGAVAASATTADVAEPKPMIAPCASWIAPLAAPLAPFRASPAAPVAASLALFRAWPAAPVAASVSESRTEAPEAGAASSATANSDHVAGAVKALPSAVLAPRVLES